MTSLTSTGPIPTEGACNKGIAWDVNFAFGDGVTMQYRGTRNGHEQVTDDLQRILDASRNLHQLILNLLDPATVHRTDGSADLAEYRRTLRHDLRTPLNAIKGYGEMLREDAGDGGGDTLVADLDKLLGEATLLLDRIDGLVTFSESREPAQGGPPHHRKGGGPRGHSAQPDTGGGRQRVE